MNRPEAGRRLQFAPAVQARMDRVWRSFAGMGLLIATVFSPVPALRAQQLVTINETFSGTTIGSDWVLAKKNGTPFTPVLTASSGGGNIDTPGNGWLRLTDAATWEATYAYNNQAFNGANATISTTFKYASYGGNGADGITFFLADASKTFAVGAYGGSLGYAQMTAAGGAVDTNGMNGGYIGLGIDEYGNYSTANEGKVGGFGPLTGQGSYPNAIAVRGPGDGLLGYDYLGGTGPSGTQLSFDQATRPTGADERTIQINITATNQLTVFLQAGDTGALEELYNIDLSGFARPDQLIMGFTAGTGGLTNIHEIQGLQLASLEASRWTNAGGTSTWASGSNWNGTNGLIPAAGADVLLNNAFVSSAQTIDVGGTRSIRSLQVDAPFAYTLNNGTLQFNNQGVLGPSGIFVSKGNGSANHTINSAIVADNAIEIKNSSTGTLNIAGAIANGGNAITLNGTGATTVSGVISGAGGIAKLGSGNTTLSAANTYSGGTTVKAGILTAGNNSAFGSGDITISGGTLAGTANQSVSNTIAVTGNAALSNLTTSGPLTQSGGNRTLVLSNATHSGAVNLSESNASRTLTLQVDSGTSTISGSIQNGGTSAGSVTKTGAGTLLLSGTNIYTGTTTVGAGTLQLGINDALSPNSSINLTGGTLGLDGFSQKVGDLSFSNDSTLDFGGTSGANTFVFGNIATQSGVLTINNWEQGLDNLGSTIGGLNVANLYFSGIGVAAQDAGTTVLGSYGSAFLIKPSTTQTWKEWQGPTGNTTWATNSNWNPNGAPNANGALASFSAGAGAGISATANIGTANRTLTGLRFTSTAQAYTITGAANRRLILDGPAGGIAYIQQQSPNNQTFTFGTLQLNKNAVIDVTGAGSLIVNSLVTDNGTFNIVKEGGGRLVLGNNNTGYNGNIFIEAGALQITNGGALGTGGNTSVANGAALEIASTTIGISSGEALNIAGHGIANTGAIYSTANAGVTNTFTNTITLDADSRIHTSSGNLLLSGALTGANRNLTLSGSGNITSNNASLTLGTGQVTIDSGGTVTFSGTGTNSYTGATNVNNGTLALGKSTANAAITGSLNIGDGSGAALSATVQLNADNQISDAAAVTIASDGRFNLNGNDETVASITGSGRIESATAANLDFGDITSTTFSGTIAGAMTLEKLGAGKTTLSGNNTYTGTTTITNGILAVQHDNALGSGGAVSVASGANLELSNDISVGNNITIRGNGTLAGDGAIQSTAGNNTLSGTITVATNAEIQSDAGTLTLSGGNAIVSSGGTRDLTFDGAGNIAVSKVIGNATNNIGNITKNGAGTLTLSGANLYSGATTINQGNLIATGGAAIGNTSAVTIASGATLTSAANNETVGSIAGGGAIALGTGAVTLTAGGNNSSTTFSGTLTGGGSTTLQKAGTGTLTLSGASGGMNGNVNLTGGTLTLANTTGSALGGVNNITVGTGTTLTLGASDQINDNATLTLAGGTFNVGGFSESMRSVTQTAASSIDFLNDGSVLSFDGINGVSSGLGTIAGGTLTIANWAGSLGGGGTEQFVIYSPSAPTLSNINFANWGAGNNATAIARGDLGAGYYELVPIVSVTDWNVNGNGNWNAASGANWVGGVTPNGAGTFVRFGNLGSAAPLTTNPVVTLTANQTAGALIFDNAADRNYTIAGGANVLTLDVTSGSAQIQVDDDGSHTISAITSMSDSTVVTNNSGAGTGLTLSGNLRQANSGTLAFTGTGTTLVSGNITQTSGSTNLLKTGSGTVVLSNGANAYTGTTTIRNGTLQVNANAPSGANGALGNSVSAVVLNDASTTSTMNTSLLIGTGGVTVGRAITVGTQGGTTTIGGSNTSGTATFSGPITMNRGVALTAATGGTTNFTGQLTAGTGTQNIAKEGAGTVVLSNAANNYNGSTTINAGTLRLGVAGALPNNTAVSVGAGGTLDVNSFSETIGSLAGAGNVTLGAPGAATVFSMGGNNGTTTFSGVLSGGANAAVTKAGTGETTLSGNNTYAGGTNVTNGTLIAGSNNALGNTGAATTTIVSNGATLGLAGGSTISNENLTLSGAGYGGEGALHNISGDNIWNGAVTLAAASTIKSDGGMLTLNGATGGAFNLTLSGNGVTLVNGAINTGAGTVTKTGGGTAILAANNGYTGATAVNAGTLEIQNSGALGTAGTTVADGATLALSGGITAGSSALNVRGEGVGGGGAVRNVSGNNTISSTVALAADATIGADDSSTLTVGNVISGGAALVKAGGGTLALNAANTYTGTTTVRNGTLTTTVNAPVSVAGALGNSATAVQLGDSGTTGSDTLAFILGNAAGGISANRAFSVNNYGSTTTLGGSNTAGTNTFGGAITLNRDLTLTSATGGNVTYSNVLSGSGGVVAAGSGTTNLNGTSTYTGTTTLRNGTLATTANAPVSANGAFGNSATAIEIGDAGTAAGNNLSLLLGNAAGGRSINRALNVNDFGNTVTIGGTNTSGTNTFAGDIALGKNVTLTTGTGGTVAFTGGVSGPGGITAAGAGTITLNGNNSFAGATTVNSGTTLVAANSNALGSTAGATTVSSGGTLGFQGNISVPSAESITISGTGVGAAGALRNISGDNTIGGPVTLAANASIGNATAGTTLTLNGTVAGTANLTKVGTGEVVLGGSAANTYTGTTTVSAGTLTLAKTGGVDAIAGGTITVQTGGSLALGGNNQINNGATLTLSGGSFVTNNNSETIGNLSLTANSSLNFSDGDNSVLTFTNATRTGGTLTVDAWNGIPTLGGGGSQLIFTNAAPTFGAGTIAFTGFAAGFTRLANGEIVPIVAGGNVYTWNSASGTTWNTNANWNPNTGSPSVANDTAIFGNGTIATNRTVSLNGADRTLGYLAFNGTGANNYTLSNNNLVFDVTAGNAQIQVDGTAAPTINSNIRLADNLNISNSSSGTLTINGGIVSSNATARNLSVTGSGTVDLNGVIGAAGTTTPIGNLTKNGTGTLILGALNHYTGTTTINNGTVQLDADATSNTTLAGSLGRGTSSILLGTASSPSDANISLLGNGGGAGGIDVNRAITVGNFGALTTIGGLNTAGTNTFTGTITLNKGVVLSAAGGTVAFTGALTAGSGTQNIVKEGAGVVMMSNVGNNYNGTTTLNAGTLQLGAAGVLPDGTAVTLAGPNTTLALANFNETIGSLAGSQATANVNLGSATLTTGGNNASTQYDGTISGTGGQLVKNGTGAMTLTGNNSYTGATTVNAGTLVAANNNALGTSAGATTVATGATLGLQGNIVVTGETLNVAAANNPTAAGLSNLAGNNTWTGNISLTGGTANDQVKVDAAAGTQLTIDGAISQATNAKAITKTGAGTVVLGGATDNTFTGGVNVNAGTLVVAKNNALGAAATATTTSVAAGATLGVQGNVTVAANKSFSLAGAAMPPSTPSLQNISGANTLNGNITLTGAANTGVAIDSASASSLTLNGAITQATSNNAVTKTGLGSVTLAGASDNTFAGGFAINDGTVYAAKTGDKDATGRANVTIGNGDAIAAALVLNGNNQIRDTSTVTINTDGQLNLQTNSDTIGALTMGGGSVLGTGTLTLSGDLTFNGTGTTVATIASNLNLGGNRLAQINNNGVGSDSDLTISGVVSGAGLTLTKAGAGTLTLTGANTYGATTISGGTLQIGNGGTTGTLGTAGVTNNAALVFNRSDTHTVAAAIMGTGTLEQAGAGTTILTGNNNYGTTTISNGTLQLGNGGTTGSIGTGNVVNNGTFAFNRSNALLVVNNISGTGGVTQAGSGTTTLTGTNTYAGPTTISAGTLEIGNGGTTGTLGSGTVSNSGTLAINRSNAYTIGGAMSGTGAFTQAGSGTTTLTGNNTYSGTTTISAGTLQVGAGGTAGTLGSGNVLNNAALTFNRSDSLGVANAISGSGSVTKSGNGTTTFTGSNSYAGTTTISAGTLQIGNGGTTGTLGTGNVVNNATLTFNRSDAVTIGNTISGTGNIIKTGTGTTTITGTNSYAGTTTINNGTLAIQNASALGSTAGGTTVTAGGTLALSNDIAIGNEAVSLQGGTLVNTSGTNSLAGPLTLLAASQVNVNSGSLTLSGAINGGGFNLTLGGGGDTFLTGSVAMGGGTLVKSGGGSLTFDDDFSFAGNLTLAGGTLNLAGADISVGTLRITGNTILDFGNSTSSSLNVGSIYIASGVTVTINNWVEWNDVFATLGWQNNAGQDITPSVPHETPNAPPIDQIDFSGWTNNQTHWDASNEITPTPEPSTYGAILLGTLTALVWWRRKKQAAALARN